MRKEKYTTTPCKIYVYAPMQVVKQWNMTALAIQSL